MWELVVYDSDPMSSLMSFTAMSLGTSLVPSHHYFLDLALVTLIAILFVTVIYLFKSRRDYSSHSFKQLIQNSGEGFRIIEGGVTTYVNPKFCQLVGLSKEQQIGKPYDIIYDEKAKTIVLEQLKLREQLKRSSYEVELTHRDGHKVLVLVSGQPIYDRKGRYRGNCAVYTDITERKKIESELRASEQRFADFAASVSDRYWEQDEQLRFVKMHDSERRQLYLSKNGEMVVDSPIGKTRWELVDADIENDPLWRNHHQDLLERKPFRDFRLTRTYTGGRTRHWSVSGRPTYDEMGNFTGYRGIARDVTAQTVAEDAAKDARLVLTNAIDSISEGFALYDADDRLVLSNERYFEMFPGLEDVLIPGTRFEDSFAALVERGLVELGEDTPEEFMRKRFARRVRANGEPFVLRFKGDKWVRVLEKRTSDGGIVGIWTDITDLKRQEQRIVQSQKMEAVGQLTGGIAHDFNNLLAVILGNLELVSERASSGRDITKMVSRAITGARRATVLTQRLLAFSRKQPLISKSTNLKELILGMMDLLHGSLGESIKIEHGFENELWFAKVDPNQLETAILNLAVNSRDAMPNGGTLSISCSNANRGISSEIGEGDYVSIVVKDTGTGMKPEIIERVFEPFFTTKSVGKGSGLGMSMVYGFAKQSGGHLEVQSEQNQGTIVTLFLPRAKTEANTKNVVVDVCEDFMSRGERVLVIEDDADVREMTVNMLESLGYEVSEASDGDSALAIIKEDTNFDLLVVDVVLPGSISGPEIVSAINETCSVKTLFMSGYANLGGIDRVSLGERAILINKPFRRLELARRVREVLDGGAVRRVKSANV